LKIFIVGDGSEKRVIQARADEINEKFPNSIHLTSWIREMALVYHALDLVCLSSKNEGTPVTLIEAQAAALPVVSTDVGGVQDVLINNVSGYVLPKNDLNGYVEKMLQLIHDPARRIQMGAEGQKHVLEKFHFQRLIQDMEHYYETLIDSNPKGK
jgi:glycosyltransferase involved in cell wall biosynthesis